MQPHPIRPASGQPPASTSTPPPGGTATKAPPQGRRGAHAPPQGPAGLPTGRTATADRLGGDADGTPIRQGLMPPRSATLRAHAAAAAAGQVVPHSARYSDTSDDLFEIPLMPRHHAVDSARWSVASGELYEIPLSPPRQPPAGEALHGSGPPDAPATRREALRAALRHGLEQWPFSAEALQDLDGQQALQEQYLDRAAGIAERRENAFGTMHPYRVAERMDTLTGDGLLAAAHEGLQSFITSAFRSPSGGALSLSVAGNEDFFPIDQTLVAATLQGAMAYAAEGALVAAGSRAALSNMPGLARNKFDDLLYEQGVAPDTVLLVIDQGTREFMLAGDARAPTAEALAEQASRKLSNIRLRQDLLDGKSFAFPLVPLMSGGFNTLRRFVSSAAVLSSPAALFTTSALASGAASGLVKFGLELGKTRAQVEIDDLMGGRQAVNLFRLNPPRPDAEPVRWSDVRSLPRFLGDAARESLALAGEAARTWPHSVADLSYRYVLVNGIANMSGFGIGGMVGQLFRPGRHFGALPGESPQSRGHLAGQMAQSTFGDAIWRGMKAAMKGRETDAAASLALRRTTRMAEQLREAARVQGELRALVARLPQDSALWAARPLLARPQEDAGPAAIDIESQRSLRATLGQAGPLDLPTLRRCRAELAALDLSEATPQEQVQREVLHQQAGRIINLLESRAATAQWLQPRP
jgi:hypothetical protein